MWSRTGFSLSLFTFLALISGSQSALADDRGKHTIAASLDIAAEYDDNANVADDSAEEPEGGLVLRVQSSLAARFPFAGHAFSLDLDADHRSVLNTDASDLNLSATAGIEFVLAGGLRINISESYVQSRFDQALREEAGAPDNDAQVLGLVVSYTHVERLKGELRFDRTRQVFETGPRSLISRDVDAVNGSVDLPVTRSIVSIASYSLEQQDAPDQPERTWSAETYRAGLRWHGRARFAVRLEGIHELIDFEPLEAEDFEDTSAHLGAKIRFTERLSSELSIGRDGFSQLSTEASVTYRSDAGRETRLSFSRETEPSFSFAFISSVVQSKRLLMSFRDRLTERLDISLDAGYQHQESVFSEEIRDDVLLHGEVRVDYPLQRRLRLGARYQFSRRTSNRGLLDFQNHRFGIVANFNI